MASVAISPRKISKCRRFLARSSTLLIFFTFLNLFGLTQASVRRGLALRPPDKRATTPPLVDLQVYPPILIGSSGSVTLTNGSGMGVIIGTTSACVVQQVLSVHSFGNSYGVPFVGSYTPPSNCSFNRVVLNLTVTVAGTQFDRLGAMYLGDTEIWRTTTSEPTLNGIIWTQIKDMSHLLTLFKQPQKFIFQLDNINDATYTGVFNTTVTATFFTAEATVVPADLIYPVSSRASADNSGSLFSLPSQNASNTLMLPKNVNKAVFSIAATGQITEEFWYTNVLNSQVNTFAPQQGSLYGYSPFREVQLYIDGMLAGVVWPFPVIFTGGVVPGLWRPIAGIDAYDLREDEIDVTPFLPLLCDGNNHTFEIRVAGIDDDGHGNGLLTATVGSFWLVTGKLFMWLDPAGSITTGTSLMRTTPAPQIQLASRIGIDSLGQNASLAYNVTVTRTLSIISNVKTASGVKKATWNQQLNYTNTEILTHYAYTQISQQETSGLDISSTGYSRYIDYPIYLNDTFAIGVNGNYTIWGDVQRGQTIQTTGNPVFPTGLQDFNNLPSVDDLPAFQGSNLRTTQNGTAVYHSRTGTTPSSSTGNTEQDMIFSGNRMDFPANTSLPPKFVGSTELYHRYVAASNAVLIANEESLVGTQIENNFAVSAAGADQQIFAELNVRSSIGRGKGSSQQSM